MSAVFLWPCSIPKDHFKLLGQNDEVALLILALYAMLLVSVNRFWWMNDWSHYILQTIYSPLEEQRLEWIKWPIKVRLA